MNPKRISLDEYGKGKEDWKEVWSLSINEKKSEKGKGYSFGELSLLKGLPWAASINALEDCDLAFLTKKDFKAVLMRSMA